MITTTLIILLCAFAAGGMKCAADKVQSDPYYQTVEWRFKYKRDKQGNILMHGDRQYSKLRKLYNYLFRVKYQEHRLFSTTLFVWTTDTWHFVNFIRHLVCCVAVYLLIYMQYDDTFVMVGIPLSFLLGFHIYNFDKDAKPSPMK
jgi:hypothetical protein